MNSSKVVGDDQRAGVAAFAEKDVEEIGERFLIVRLLADEGVGVEPEQLAFLVVVLSASPVGPRGIAAAQDAGGDGGVFGGPPVAARACCRGWRRTWRAGRGTGGCDLRPERAASTLPRYCVMPS